MINISRPTKRGIDYFPLDVDFLQDTKIRKIMRSNGTGSIAILISLLSSIYKDNGYFTKWDSDIPFLVADEVGASEGAVSEVVNKSVQVGFFDKELYEKYKILTSKGIQKRYMRVAEKRKSIELFREYLLLELVNVDNNSVNVCINSINVYNNSINSVVNTQSKEKESKEKESKENILSGNPTAQIVNYLNQVCGTKFKATTKDTKQHINARLNEGFKLDDFIEVIDKKYFEWGKRPDMVQFLRPRTLFGTKFEGYLNQPWTDGRKANPTDLALMNFVADAHEEKNEIIINNESEVDLF